MDSLADLFPDVVGSFKSTASLLVSWSMSKIQSGTSSVQEKQLVVAVASRYNRHVCVFCVSYPGEFLFEHPF